MINFLPFNKYGRSAENHRSYERRKAAKSLEHFRCLFTGKPTRSRRESLVSIAACPFSTPVKISVELRLLRYQKINIIDFLFD
ncbi:hypothetical protein TNCV_3894501 [Trichonephila clavipes]|nr:hypothetical protein TNCV_3894501 [Trichonephila clavipes]